MVLHQAVPLTFYNKIALMKSMDWTTMSYSSTNCGCDVNILSD